MRNDAQNEYKNLNSILNNMGTAFWDDEGYKLVEFSSQGKLATFA